MLSISELSTRKCVENNRNLFEDVAKGFVNAKDMYRTEYSILNYEMILDQMIQFIDGYVEYANDNTKQYEGKVLAVTRNFFNSMFIDKKKYRKKINLDEFMEINKRYLEKTKQLQSIIERYLKDGSISRELDSLLRLTDNQYKKIAKVYRDDMKIYLWLTSSNSKFFAYHLDESTRSEFSNKNSPVMHKVDKNDFRE